MREEVLLELRDITYIGVRGRGVFESRNVTHTLGDEGRGMLKLRVYIPHPGCGKGGLLESRGITYSGGDKLLYQGRGQPGVVIR